MVDQLTIRYVSKPEYCTKVPVSHNIFLITASLAKKYERKVFAVPGPLTSVLSKGTNQLIKDGALYEVESLIGAGVDVNVKNSDDETALMWAAQGGSSEIVRMFVEKGAEVNVKTKDGLTPLSLAKEHEHEHDVKLLVAAGAI